LAGVCAAKRTAICAGANFVGAKNAGGRGEKIYFPLRLVLNKNDPYLPLIDLAC
jgi:hypothetical protein